MNIRESLRSLRPALPFFVGFLLAQLCLRVFLLNLGWSSIDTGWSQIVAAFAVGFAYDAVVALCGASLVLWLRVFIPEKWRHRKQDRLLMSALITCLLLAGVTALIGDWLFWEDIGARINFLAIDYLTYPHEVIGFLVSSYSVHLLLPLIVAIALGICAVAYRFLVPEDPQPRTRATRWVHATSATVLSLFALTFVTPNLARVSNNHYVNEAAKNGVYSFIAAVLNYDRPYTKNYPVIDDQEAGLRLRAQLQGKYARFETDDPEDITRIIEPPGPEKRYNVMLIVMESMSACYMERYGCTEGLTPVLDALAEESLFFSNHYASGMRTVRGVEAVSLSSPPTPGPAVVKRADNGNLFTLGWVMRDRGYDTRFAYNGHARFDSMEGYFAKNGFDILDRRDFSQDEVTFENSWGVCDEDMYMKLIQQADHAHERQQPFLFMHLTTSNHRPFTYPLGTIEPPEGGDPRLTAVKYADYAVGRFLEEAKKHPWFDNTLFVFTADHAAISTGKRELTLEKHRIPFIVYAPKLISAEDNPQLACQIDIPPTLCGILNLSYRSRFYGKDVLNDPQNHVILGNFEHLGRFQDDKIIILKPQAGWTAYHANNDPRSDVSDDELSDTVCFYQHGAKWRDRKTRVSTVL